MEYLGYLATILVITSFMVKEIIMLRALNTIGAVLFCYYAMLIESMPVLLTNALIGAINIYHLSKLNKQQKE
jgi:NADH:ubiquinone oxidoreductase subunit 6 (subunit J)